MKKMKLDGENEMKAVILRLPAALVNELDAYARSVELPGGMRLSRNMAARHLLQMQIAIKKGQP